MVKQIVSKAPKVLLACALVGSAGVLEGVDTILDNTSTQYAYAETTLACNTPTQDEIKQAWKEAGIDWYEQPVYIEQPVLTAPYNPGVLSQTSLENGLKALNLLRYIAGVDPVELSGELNQQAQAGALIQAINGGVLTHSPSRPAGMSDELYTLAQQGCSQTLGSDSSVSAAAKSMISDLGVPNVGHRRIVLGSNVNIVGFGLVKNRSAINVSASSYEQTAFRQTVWPAENMPIELMSQGLYWSYSTNNGSIHEMIAKNIFVSVTNKNTGETQRFTDSTITISPYGGYVSFRPSFEVKAGDSYLVEITGLEEGFVSYTVNFFNATDSCTEPTPESPSTPSTPNPPSSGTITPTDKPTSKLNAAWVKSGSSWWYRYGDGTYPANRWEQISGTWYHFDSAGWMQTGWQYISGKWYYLNSSGAMLTGWQYIGGKWYYLNPAGDMAIGWKQVGGSWYYLNSSGAMQTGWLKQGNSWYYLNSSGAMQTGWYKVGSSWYYSNASGVMQSNKWIGNYYVGISGAMATSTWIGEYHVNASGLWDKTA